MKRTPAKFVFHISLFFAFNGLLTSVDAAPLSFDITDLGAGTASAINDLGQAVVQSTAGAPFVWSSGTGAVNLTLGSYYSAVALGINNRGQIVGYGNFLEERFSALRWDRPD